MAVLTATLDNPPGGWDGRWFRWEYPTGLFTMVKITAHTLGRSDPCMRPRNVEAVKTLGRSKIERHLDDPVPPRVIEVGTSGDPFVTRR